MADGIAELLSADHARLDALLARSIATDVIDHVAYEQFRAGLLRHIAMEEKVLFAEARRRAGAPLPIVKRLHADHAALASLLVPPPTHALLETVRAVLGEHNPLEEGNGGFYASCERLTGSDAQILARMQALPLVRIAQHVDEPRVHEHITRMLAARRNV